MIYIFRFFIKKKKQPLFFIFISVSAGAGAARPQRVAKVGESGRCGDALLARAGGDSVRASELWHRRRREPARTRAS